MASLTRVSIVSRKAIRYSIYAVILLIIARYSIRAGVAIYRRYNPAPPPPPTVGFGTLTALPFPDQQFPQSLQFTLETPEGGLPQFPDQLPVYFMPPQVSELGDLDNARQVATALGFNPNGSTVVQNVPNVYVFPKDQIPQTLTMNIITGTFSISYDIASDPSVISGIPPAQDTAVTTINGFLGSANLAPDDISTNARITTLFKRIEGGQLVDAVALSEADLIWVNLFRKNFTDQQLPSMTPDAVEANVWFTLGGTGQVVSGEYHYYPVDESRVETYPIKTAEAAFEQLRNGNAFLAHRGNQNQNNIVIRRVYLAYYDAGQYTEFYQPIVVFEGDDEFFAYVPAVTDEYYGAQ